MNSQALAILPGLLPPGIESAEGVPEQLGDCDGLYEAELEAIAKAVRTRREQYAATRHLARSVFARLGVPAQPVLNRTDRSPIWPKGYLGTITHTQGWCAVALSSEQHFVGIGIDAERADAIETGVAERVLTEREWKNIEHHGHPPEQLGSLWFSAKESVYKCIFPTVGRFIGFQEVEVHLNFEAGSFEATAISEELRAEHGTLVSALKGRFKKQEGLWITTATVQKTREGA